MCILQLTYILKVIVLSVLICHLKSWVTAASRTIHAGGYLSVY